jgi:hypothetical protein
MLLRMSNYYFIVRSTEDGTRVDGPLDQKTVLGRITPNGDGETYYGSNLEFLRSVPESDKGCWMGTSEGAILILKGEIVIPRVVEIVKKLALEIS